MLLHHEAAGEGEAVVLLHAGICDSSMWDPQWRAFSARYRTVRLDFPGYGRSELEPGRMCLAEDVLAVLDACGFERAALVGVSLGGRVALELAVAEPQRVSALVLVGSALLGHEWSAAVQAYNALEEAALERGDLDAAVEVCVQLWVDGLHRAPGEVDPAVRAAVAAMQRRAFEQWLPLDAEIDEEALVPDLAERLAEISCPALVVVGELDVEDIHAVAERLRREIRGARYCGIAGTAHVPSMERPAAFAEAVLGFLAEVL